MMTLPSYLLLLSLSSVSSVGGAPPPHIVLILADDLGWADVSWHNDQVKTPHMDRLSGEGVRLDQSYVTPKCSPSRAALMTGVYPHKLGRQRGAIERFQPTGLNTSYTLLPQYLKMVGKWHLGYCHPHFLPNNRGFDSSFGQWNHVVDYYTRRTDNPKDSPEKRVKISTKTEK